MSIDKSIQTNYENIDKCLKIAQGLMNIGLCVTIIIVFVALGMPLSLPARNAYAQDVTTQGASVNNSTLYVTGDAQTKVKPDKVMLSLSVETTNMTADEALNANSEVINNTLEALKGIRCTPPFNPDHFSEY